MNANSQAIKVESLSKCYRLGLKEETHDTLSASFFHFLKRPWENFRKYRSLYSFEGLSPDDPETTGNGPSNGVIWALKNVSFEVPQGEVLGIIGHNGSGKSTILKIFSRITFPTRGQVEIRGRSACLLEVGTGFHPELTGRENVYLNGTVLGMKKKEIDRKFDEIVDFSGVEKFIDTPVKRYSSGMAVRLAFAVAAHLEPEILIIDEVLAVGDAEFQAKCIGKMSSFAKEGRTVLFVSHNMGAVSELCSRVLWLHKGCVKLDATPSEAVNKYLSTGGNKRGTWKGSLPVERSGRMAQLLHARVFSEGGDPTSTLFSFNERIQVEIQYQVNMPVKLFKAYLLLRDSLRNIIWASHDSDGRGTEPQDRDPGIYSSICVFPLHLLRPGGYAVTIGIFGSPGGSVNEEHVDVLRFRISFEEYLFNHDPRKGLLAPFLPWQITCQSGANQRPDLISK